MGWLMRFPRRFNGATMIRRLWGRLLYFRYVQRERARLRARRDDRPLRLTVGASHISQEGWIETEAGYLNLLQPRHWERCLRRDTVDAIVAEHVWEHLTPEEGVRAAACCRDYLRPGGHLRIAVPDGFHPDPDYIAHVRPGGAGEGADDHKALYTVETLTALLGRAGLRAEPREWFDAAGQFHFVEWSPGDGMIRRSRRFDPRNEGGKLAYTSLIIDAFRD